VSTSRPFCKEDFASIVGFFKDLLDSEIFAEEMNDGLFLAQRSHRFLTSILPHHNWSLYCKTFYGPN